MNTLNIEGHDVQTGVPVNGVIRVGAFIRSRHQVISIEWKLKESIGYTECEAWRGQYEIDELTKSGHQITLVQCK